MLDTFVRKWFHRRTPPTPPASFAAQLRQRNTLMAGIYARMRVLERLLEQSGYPDGVQHDYVDFASDTVIYAAFVARESGVPTPITLHFTFTVAQLDRMDEDELRVAIRTQGAAVRPPVASPDDVWEEEFCARSAPRIVPRRVTRPRRFPRLWAAS